jgi:hypothetical protein
MSTAVRGPLAVERAAALAAPTQARPALSQRRVRDRRLPRLGAPRNSGSISAMTTGTSPWTMRASPTCPSPAPWSPARSGPPGAACGPGGNAARPPDAGAGPRRFRRRLAVGDRAAVLDDIFLVGAVGSSRRTPLSHTRPCGSGSGTAIDGVPEWLVIGRAHENECRSFYSSVRWESRGVGWRRTASTTR